METQVPQSETCPNCDHYPCRVEVIEDRRPGEDRVIVQVECIECAIQGRELGTITYVENERLPESAL